MFVAPSSSPENVQLSAVSSSGFLLSWSAPPAVNHNGIIRNYTINITEENTGRWIQLTSNTNSQRVESLHPHYNYTCVVSAVTVAAGPYSSPVFVTTLEDGKGLLFLQRATTNEFSYSSLGISCQLHGHDHFINLSPPYLGPTSHPGAQWHHHHIHHHSGCGWKHDSVHHC